jgi:hypothetical protein
MEDRVAAKAGTELKKGRTQVETEDLLSRDVNILRHFLVLL